MRSHEIFLMRLFCLSNTRFAPVSKIKEEHYAKRIISLFLAAAMLVGLLPTHALAQEAEQTASSPVTGTVQQTAQMEGLMNPKLGAEVSSDLAESVWICRSGGTGSGVRIGCAGQSP